MGIRKRLVVPDTLLEGSSMKGMRLRARQSVIAKREEARATSLAQATAITEKTEFTHPTVYLLRSRKICMHMHTHTHALMCTHYTVGLKYCLTVLNSLVTEINNKYVGLSVLKFR